MWTHNREKELCALVLPGWTNRGSKEWKARKAEPQVAQSGLEKMQSPRGGVAQRQRSARSKILTGWSDELVLLINVVDPLIWCHGGIENKYMNLQQWKMILWPTHWHTWNYHWNQTKGKSEWGMERTPT